MTMSTRITDQSSSWPRDPELSILQDRLNLTTKQHTASFIQRGKNLSAPERNKKIIKWGREHFSVRFFWQRQPSSQWKALCSCGLMSCTSLSHSDNISISTCNARAVQQPGSKPSYKRAFVQELYRVIASWWKQSNSNPKSVFISF